MNITIIYLVGFSFKTFGARYDSTTEVEENITAYAVNEISLIKYLQTIKV